MGRKIVERPADFWGRLELTAERAATALRIGWEDVAIFDAVGQVAVRKGWDNEDTPQPLLNRLCYDAAKMVVRHRAALSRVEYAPDVSDVREYLTGDVGKATLAKILTLLPRRYWLTVRALITPVETETERATLIGQTDRTLRRHRAIIAGHSAAAVLPAAAEPEPRIYYSDDARARDIRGYLGLYDRQREGEWTHEPRRHSRIEAPWTAGKHATGRRWLANDGPAPAHDYYGLPQLPEREASPVAGTPWTWTRPAAVPPPPPAPTDEELEAAAARADDARAANAAAGRLQARISAVGRHRLIACLRRDLESPRRRPKTLVNGKRLKKRAVRALLARLEGEQAEADRVVAAETERRQIVSALRSARSVGEVLRVAAAAAPSAPPAYRLRPETVARLQARRDAGTAAG